VLQHLSERTRLCHERAAEARRRAEETSDPKVKAQFLNTEKRWLLLARSYQFSESLNDFVRAIPDQPSRDKQPLHSWEKNLQTMIDNTPFMLTQCSSDLRYQFISKAYAQMIGRPT
jgi:hypothetical protein